MAATGFEQIIDPPEVEPRTRGLLLGAATDLMIPDDLNAIDVDPGTPISGERWHAGVTFTTLGTSTLRRGEALYCGSADQVTPGTVDRAIVVFQAFAVIADEQCSALSINEAWLTNRLAERFEVGVSKAVAAELMDGANTLATPCFKDTTQIVGGATVVETMALPTLEEALADKLNGGAGIVHMSPKAFTRNAINQTIEWDGLNYRSPTGHLVVADAGYTGQTPTAGTTTAGAEYMYGSGTVGIHLGPPRRLGTDNIGVMDRTRNIIHAEEIAMAVFAFDPAAVVAVKFTLAT